MRKVIQIAAAIQSGASYPDLFAVCDDGTTWQMLNHDSTWQRLPDIPQPDTEPSLLPQISRCNAMQHSDQMVCAPCNIAWDMNDPAPPACRRSLLKG